MRSCAILREWHGSRERECVWILWQNSLRQQHAQWAQQECCLTTHHHQRKAEVHGGSSVFNIRGMLQHSNFLGLAHPTARLAVVFYCVLLSVHWAWSSHDVFQRASDVCAQREPCDHESAGGGGQGLSARRSPGPLNQSAPAQPEHSPQLLQELSTQQPPAKTRYADPQRQELCWVPQSVINNAGILTVSGLGSRQDTAQACLHRGPTASTTSKSRTWLRCFTNP